MFLQYSAQITLVRPDGAVVKGMSCQEGAK